MKIDINGAVRDATVEEIIEFEAAQASAFQAPSDPLAQPLDRLRFWLAAASAGVSKWSVRERIAAMPETTYDEKVAKSEAIAWFEEAKQYRRDDPLLIHLAAAEGISGETLDRLWAWAVPSAPQPS